MPTTMPTTIEGGDTCRTCGKSEVWHRANKPIHPFNDGSAGATAFLGKRGHRAPTTGLNDTQRAPETAPRPVFPSDPVLRVALMNAGVITPDQLRTAEQQLAVAFNQMEADRGQSAESTRGREVQVGTPAEVPLGGVSGSGEEVGTQPGHEEV